MAEPYRIRSTSLADLPALAALELISFSDPWTEEQIGGSLQWSGNAALLAETVDGELLGHVIGRVVVDQAEILSLATAPAARRQGIAARLLADLLALMQERGAISVWLEVRESNLAARALYEGKGFFAEGRRRRYYRDPTEDALVLRKDLEPSASPGTVAR